MSPTRPNASRRGADRYGGCGGQTALLGALVLLLCAAVLSACDLPIGGPHSGAEGRAVALAEASDPAEISVEQLFHIVNYLPEGDFRRAFWFCQAALRSDYPFAEVMAVRMGACHRFSAWDCGGQGRISDDKVRAFAWYSYAAKFNPAVTARLIDPLQRHMTVEELAMARAITGEGLTGDDRISALRSFLDCEAYQFAPR